MKSSPQLFISALILVFAVSSPATAGIINLGDAANYNAFVYEDFQATSSDVEGRLAAGGNVSIRNYSVNIKGSSQLYTDTDKYPALVVGGDLDYSSGNIAGNVFVGGNYTPTGTGTITNGAATVGGSSPIDFDAEFAHLTNLSEQLSLLAVNGDATDKWSTQHLTGSGSNGAEGDLHVFSLDASDMNFSDYLLSGVDKGDTVLFNISGDNIATSWGNFGGSDSSLNNVSGNILFNFFEAETLQINAALYGSILAPKANITAPTGVIWGQVIVNSWTGNTQINDNPFSDNTVTVPEPSTLAVFLLGLMGVAARRFS